MPLTPKHFDVLRVLVQHSGHLVEKERLLKEVWPDSYVEEGALNRSVSVLRKALGESASGQKYIETVPKRGYRFVAPVTVSSRRAPQLRRRDDSRGVRCRSGVAGSAAASKLAQSTIASAPPFHCERRVSPACF